MILYSVRNGIITAEKVLKETRCGWRNIRGGFTNRSELRPDYIRLDHYYFTTSYDQACEWATDILQKMESSKQVARAAMCDIKYWIEGGMDEDSAPDSRIVIK